MYSDLVYQPHNGTVILLLLFDQLSAVLEKTVLETL